MRRNSETEETTEGGGILRSQRDRSTTRYTASIKPERTQSIASILSIAIDATTPLFWRLFLSLAAISIETPSSSSLILSRERRLASRRLVLQVDAEQTRRKRLLERKRKSRKERKKETEREKEEEFAVTRYIRYRNIVACD